MSLFKFFLNEKINFQDKFHHSQFKGYFQKREQTYDEVKSYKKINSFKNLLDYLHQKFPDVVIPHYDYPFLFDFNYIFKT